MLLFGLTNYLQIKHSTIFAFFFRSEIVWLTVTFGPAFCLNSICQTALVARQNSITTSIRTKIEASVFSARQELKYRTKHYLCISNHSMHYQL